MEAKIEPPDGGYGWKMLLASSVVIVGEKAIKLLGYIK